jgi:hypothetical protein
MDGWMEVRREGMRKWRRRRRRHKREQGPATQRNF